MIAHLIEWHVELWLLVALGTAVTITDLRSQTIPNGLLLAGLIVLGGWQCLTGHAVAAAVGGATTLALGLLLWRFTPGFGGGDVRYWAVLGVALDGERALWVLILAAAGALAWGVVSGDWRRRGRRAAIALGPWLAGASVVLWFR